MPHIHLWPAVLSTFGSSVSSTIYCPCRILSGRDFFAVVSRSVSEDPLYECGLPLLNHCLFSPPYLLLSLQHLYCVLESLVVPVC